MLYAYINENGTLCATYELEYVPEQFRSSVQVFEDLDLTQTDRLTLRDGQIVVLSDSEILEKRKAEVLAALKRYAHGVLSQTDWIFVKKVELGMSDEEFAQHYGEILSDRQQFRETIAQKKNRIQSATSIAELNAIAAEFGAF